jgi:hypothetical protein
MATSMNSMRKLMLNLPRFGYGNWWVEITTSDPSCIYYFGPFLDFEEAADRWPHYVRDLINEGAQKIITVIKCCHPAELTKCDEQ